MKKFLKELLCSHVWCTDKIDDLGSGHKRIYYDLRPDIQYKNVAVHSTCIKCTATNVRTQEVRLFGEEAEQYTTTQDHC